MELKDEMAPAFSSGTGGMNWYLNNCDRCTKAYLPKDGEYPSDKTMKQYCRTGKECKLKYHVDLGFILGEIPLCVADQIGHNNGFLKESCMMFSDNDDDGWTPPKRPKPDRTPDNQMVLPFELNEILEGHTTKVEELQ